MILVGVFAGPLGRNIWISMYQGQGYVAIGECLVQPIQLGQIRIADRTVRQNEDEGDCPRVLRMTKLEAVDIDKTNIPLS